MEAGHPSCGAHRRRCCTERGGCQGCDCGGGHGACRLDAEGHRGCQPRLAFLFGANGGRRKVRSSRSHGQPGRDGQRSAGGPY